MKLKVLALFISFSCSLLYPKLSDFKKQNRSIQVYASEIYSVDEITLVESSNNGVIIKVQLK